MNKPSAIYLDYPDTPLAVLQKSLERGLDAGGTSPVPVYFRADDIGVISESFIKLLVLFEQHRTPLCLAVVPVWITSRRWSTINSICDTGSSLWCWHQHGWRHRNHQLSGKNSEFGPDRSIPAIKKDIINGRNRLLDILGSRFSPYFTPPWNRCSRQTLIQLQAAGFKGLSTDRRAGRPDPEAPVPDLQINVDLHTRKEPDGSGCLLGMAAELETAARNGGIGFMIHHQHMNDTSFRFLEKLLEVIRSSARLTPVHFRDLL